MFDTTISSIRSNGEKYMGTFHAPVRGFLILNEVKLHPQSRRPAVHSGSLVVAEWPRVGRTAGGRVGLEDSRSSPLYSVGGVSTEMGWKSLSNKRQLVYAERHSQTAALPRNKVSAAMKRV